ncbi:MAG: hypothetical protein ACRBDI_04905 [Alphaproteobacteria bacterium]
MILIAFISCLQILLGLFLIIGSKQEHTYIADHKDLAISPQNVTLAKQQRY